jgi:hypothetical protein
VPVSHLVNDQIEYGQPLTTTQILDTAIARFNTHSRSRASFQVIRSILWRRWVSVGRWSS